MVRLYGLKIESGSRQGNVLFLGEGEYSLGRDITCSIILSDTKISLVHASLISNKDGLFISDEGSTTGTYINDKAIGEQVKLRDNDRIRLGETMLRVVQTSSSSLPIKKNQIIEKKQGDEENLFNLGGFGITPVRLFVLFVAAFGLLFGGTMLLYFVGYLIGIHSPKALAIAVFLASLPLFPYLYLIHMLDYHRRIPVFLLLTSFIWGSIGATGVAVLINTASRGVLTSL